MYDLAGALDRMLMTCNEHWCCTIMLQRLLPIWVQPELKGAAGSKQDTQRQQYIRVSDQTW